MKKVISLLLCCTMVAAFCVPAFAADESTMSPPPGIVLLEGETWIPAPNGIMPREPENADCGLSSHLVPAGYRYVGYKQGDANVESAIVSGGGIFVSLFIPGLGLITNLIGIGLLLDPNRISGTYNEYIWTNGSRYWIHTVGYSVYTVNGQERHEYVNCKVTTPLV